VCAAEVKKKFRPRALKKKCAGEKYFVEMRHSSGTGFSLWVFGIRLDQHTQAEACATGNACYGVALR
jgi:hypothetical protein